MLRSRPADATFDEATSPRDGEPEPGALRYEPVEELGRGGLGKVTRARDRVLGREVAVKELLVPNPGARARFAREMRITARLEHPGIVPVHDAGTNGDGVPFYAMKLIAGQSLADAIRAAASPEARLALVPRVLAIADAVAFAHRAGVVHRDLKPHNAMIGEYGETLVVDWGLAKELGADDADDPPDGRPADPQLTRAGAIVGTPAFMAPEQARGAPVDARADVYALGRILYQVLSGSDPFVGLSGEEVVARVAAGGAVAEIPGVPADLAAIVAQATRVDPAARYPSAAELAADLRAFLNGQMVSARTYGTGELLQRFVQQNLRSVAVVGALGIALVVVVLVAFGVVVRERDAARLAEQEKTAALEREQASNEDFALAQARMALEVDPRAALAILAGLAPDPRRAGEVRILAADALSRRHGRRLGSHDAAVGALAWSPDGSSLASGSHDRTARIWDLAGGPPRVISGLAEGVDVAFSPDGKAVLASSLGEVRSVRVADGSLAWSVPLGDADAQVGAFDPTGRLWAVGTSSSTVFAIEASSGEVRRFWDLQGNDANDLYWADADVLMVLDADGTVFRCVVSTGEHAVAWQTVPLWYRAAHGPDGTLAIGKTDVHLFGPDGRPGRVLPAGSGWVSALLFSQDGATLYGAGSDGRIRAWDPRTGVLLWSEYAHRDGVTGLCETRDALVSSGGDGVIRLRRPDGTIEALTGSGPPVGQVACAERQVASATMAGEVATWDTALRDPAVHVHSGGWTRGIAVGVDNALWSGGDDGEVGRADAAGWALATRFPPGATAVAASRGGSVFAGGRSGVRQLDPTTGAVVAEASFDDVRGLSVAPDDRTVLVRGLDGVLGIWSPGSAVLRVPAHSGRIWVLGWSGDGRRFATGSDDHAVGVWAAEQPPRRIALLTEHRGDITDLAFLPDGRLATASVDGRVLIWSDLEGTPAFVSLPGAHNEISAMTVSPDGRTIAASDAVGSISLWDAGDPAVTRLVTGHTQYVNHLRFSPDGRTLFSVSWDGTLRAWDTSDWHRGVLGRVVGRSSDALVQIAVSPDGRVLAAGSTGGALLSWRDDLPTEPDALSRAITAALSDE